MATDKDAEYKLRQQEYRKLNKRKVKLPKEFIPRTREREFEMPLEVIKYK